MHLPSVKIALTPDDIHWYIAARAKRDTELDFLEPGDMDIASDKKMLKLSVLISSMANSCGGKIICGIRCKGNRAASMSFFDGNVITKAGIENAIVPIISRRIEGIEILPVLFNNDPAQMVYVISVPASHRAPHMAADNRYYQRNRFHPVIMEEHQVRLLYLRSGQPELEFFGIINTGGIPVLSDGKIVVMNFFPKILIRNISSSIEQTWKLEIRLPAALVDTGFSALQNNFSHPDGDVNVYAIPGRMPLFQDEVHTALEMRFSVNAENFPEFEKGMIDLRLYYSGGLKTMSLALVNTFQYNNRMLEKDGFAEKDQTFVKTP